MQDRFKLEQIINRVGIPKTTVAGLAGTAPTNVSLFFKGGSVSERMESRIRDAIREIVGLTEKFHNVPLDLSNVDAIKRLLREQPAIYSVMIQTEPARYFLRKDAKQTYMTHFFLSSGVFHLPIARAIKEDLIAAGLPAVIVENPYRSIDSVGFLELDFDDPRETTQYRCAMGLPTVGAAVESR